MREKFPIVCPGGTSARVDPDRSEPGKPYIEHYDGHKCEHMSGETPVAIKVVRKPTEHDAIQWDGTWDRFREIQLFTVGRFVLKSWSGDGYEEGEAEVYDFLHKTWITAYVRDWIVKGSGGECWPVRDDVFSETYEIREADVGQ